MCRFVQFGRLVIVCSGTFLFRALARRSDLGCALNEKALSDIASRTTPQEPSATVGQIRVIYLLERIDVPAKPIAATSLRFP